MENLHLYKTMFSVFRILSYNVFFCFIEDFDLKFVLVLLSSPGFSKDNILLDKNHKNAIA